MQNKCLMKETGIELLSTRQKHNDFSYESKSSCHILSEIHFMLFMPIQ
ncbi:hypothetical protein X798_00563, partial [Onchocerca flexuosa]